MNTLNDLINHLRKNNREEGRPLLVIEDLSLISNEDHAELRTAGVVVINADDAWSSIGGFDTREMYFWNIRCDHPRFLYIWSRLRLHNGDTRATKEMHIYYGKS